MSENDRNEPKKGPDYIAYNVRDYGGEKAAWDRIGAAFKHKDGQGADILLNSTPLDGRITIREAAKEEFKSRRAEEPEREPDRDRTRRR